MLQFYARVSGITVGAAPVIGELERANLVIHLAAIFLYIYIYIGIILGECMALLASGSDPTV